MWVRCCPRVAVMGVENTLSRKDASSVNNTEAAKKWDLQFVAASTTVKRSDEVQVTFFLVTGRAAIPRVLKLGVVPTISSTIPHSIRYVSSDLDYVLPSGMNRFHIIAGVGEQTWKAFPDHLSYVIPSRLGVLYLVGGRVHLDNSESHRKGRSEMPFYLSEAPLALNRRFLLGVWTVNSHQSHIVKVYDAGHGKSGVFNSAEWHDGDWSKRWNPGGVAMVLHLGGKFLSFLAWLRAKRLLSDWMLGTVNIDSDWLPGI
ncbi:hypothetical protein TNCV_3326821 [Trichonephila clavipes]|nr:hypothetical protein TNCV_3326821 [Trichonephila clavipes]